MARSGVTPSPPVSVGPLRTDRNAAALVLGALLGVLSVAVASQAQQPRMKMITAEGGVHLLQEARVVLVAEDDAVVVNMVLPSHGAATEESAIDLEEGDRILMMNRQRVRSIDDVRAIYDALDVGAEIQLGVKRGDDMMIQTVPKADPSEMKGRVVMRTGPPGGPGGAPDGGHVETRSLSIDGVEAGEVRALFGAGVLLAPAAEGEGIAVIARLPPMGPKAAQAEASALVEGDVVESINGTLVASLAELFEVHDRLGVGAEITLGIRRAGMSQSVTFPKAKDPGELVIRRDQ